MNTEPTHKLTVKIGDALRTIQGYTYDEFSALRDELISGLNADLECVQLAKAATNAAPIVGGGTAVAAPAAAPTAPAPPAPAAPASAGWGTPPPQQFAPSFQQATTPSCQHGPRVPRSGMGQKGPWKSWFCPAPKGDPTQCDGIFVKRGTPEWDTHPA